MYIFLSLWVFGLAQAAAASTFKILAPAPTKKAGAGGSGNATLSAVNKM